MKLALAIVAIMALLAVTPALADHNGVTHTDETAEAELADLSIIPAGCAKAAVVASAPQPVAGVQAFIRMPEAIILDIQESPPLADVVMLKKRMAGGVGYAAGNLPRPYGTGFPEGAFQLFTIRYYAIQSVRAKFYSQGHLETLVASPGGEDITGDLAGATLYPCARN